MPSLRGDTDWPPKARSENTMTIPNITNAHSCSYCGRRLRNAFFCQQCGESLCSWECFQRHFNQHPRVPSRAATNHIIRSDTAPTDCSS